ncbi:ferritin subunit [Macrosteles quadrilineatus]|uniref:ferritin subunit n=1 Tax=Macrosteles quadrilineatus TaxID=74068 RepID=UPI0023E21462|nr:ferritin subunit [Macrosteles quadrilineatus]
MKNLAVFVLIFIVPLINGDQLHCKLPDVLIPTEWKSMVTDCTRKMRDQVQMELTASVTYMAMGSYFLQDTVNRPGFAKFFLESASEERQHALKLMEYLLMRGELTTTVEFDKLIDNPKPLATSWPNGVEALKAALDLETKVTNRIRDIIVTCEEPSNKYNDYHLVDWLTADFLDEQYKGQRELAGKISTLSKMMKEHGVLGEFLYDKTM